jgi:3-oxoadipate enol-lactonase
MPRIDLSGVSLHYQLSGRPGAPVLMLSNSLGTTLHMWAPQLQEFEARFQLLRYDVRGHGESLTTPGPYTIDLLGGDVLALLDALDIPRVHFCGLSVGGVLGQWLAIHARSRLDRLVLCNTAAKIGTPENWNARIAQVRQGGMEAIADAVIDRWFTAPFRAARPPIVAAMRRMLAAAGPAGYVATCEAIRDMDQREQAARIARPTLIVAGEFDQATTVADAQFLESAIPGAVLTVLPAAHISNAELPAQFNAAVLSFLTKDGVQ